jgi:integrase
MLFRLVRPVRRQGSSVPQFVQRIPADVKGRAVGLKLAVPVGEETVSVTISPRADTIRLSLRTRDESEAKVRQARVAAYVETFFQGLRRERPVSLSPRQAHALAGELYRSWADEERGRSLSIEHTGRGWRRAADDPAERSAEWSAVVEAWGRLEGADDAALEKALGPLVDRLLLSKGVLSVEPEARRELLWAFWQALRDAFAVRKRQAEGDYAADPNAARFPEWQAPSSGPSSPPREADRKQSLRGLVADWWKEAQATGLTISTYESYRNTMARFVALLGHDEAGRVTAEDVLRFKDHRLSQVNPRTGKALSAKTVKDSDLAGLKSVFAWALANRRIGSNPAAGISIKLGRKVRTRSRGFTGDEAMAVLTHALRCKRGSERAKTFAAKRWVPWLCAYTGARVGEMVQLRKRDVRREEGHWIVTITPDAFTVKDKQAREVPLHDHLIELGFSAFVEAAPEGYLFLNDAREGSNVRGRWRGVKNRVCEFVREVVTDPRVAPNHAWRHLFKTIGREAEIQEGTLDAICGHAPSTVGQGYGEVTLRAKVKAVARFPRFVVADKPGARQANV